MDRVQRSGLIALAVLLLTAVGAHFVGSRPGSDASVPESKLVQDPAAWEGVAFLPPEQRQKFVGARDFARPPIRNPLTGVGTRNILDGIDEPPDDDGTGKSGLGQGAMLLSLDGGDPVAPQPEQAPSTPRRDLKTGPGTGRDPQRVTRVREGDNLTKLASRVLGNEDRWREIADLNEIGEPFVVRVGDLLYLPPSEPAGGAIAQAGGNQSEPSRAQPASAPRTYRVQPGDTPSEISQKVYQTSKHWKKILSANGIRDARGLRAGQTLTIPPLD